MSPRVKHNDDGSVTVALKYPIEHGERVISAVTIRGECTVTDLESMDDGDGDIDKTVRMLSQLSSKSIGEPGLPVSVLKKMRTADYLLLAREVGRIIGGDDEGNESPQTGGNT